MAKRRKIPLGQVNRRNNQTLQNLKKLMEDLGQKYSIKVGILQAKGRSHLIPNSDITMADLGAIHEFGATINNTPKMRGWFYHNYGIQKSNNPIKIPARPFLRPLLNPKSKKYILENSNLADNPELDKLLGEDNPKFIENITHNIAESATLLVQHSFNTGGFPQKWKEITPFSREHRKYNHNSPPLTDIGQLKQSISYEIKRVN